MEESGQQCGGRWAYLLSESWGRFGGAGGGVLGRNRLGWPQRWQVRWLGAVGRFATSAELGTRCAPTRASLSLTTFNTRTNTLLTCFLGNSQICPAPIFNCLSSCLGSHKLAQHAAAYRHHACMRHRDARARPRNGKHDASLCLPSAAWHGCEQRRRHA